MVFDDMTVPASPTDTLQNRNMLHDTAVYGPETDKFLPERFLNPGIKNPTMAFGFGRRQALVSYKFKHLNRLEEYVPGDISPIILYI